MRSLVLSFLLTSVVFAPCSQAQQKPPESDQANDKSRYIGLRHGDQIPAGHKWIGGALLSDPYRDKTQYGVDQVSRGTVNMLWLQLLTHHDSAGHAYWEIKDVLFLPIIQKNQLLFYTDCLLANKPDPELVVIADTVRRGGYYTRVRHAWRANRQTEKFEQIPVTGIKCVGQGDD
jgi:hypothetical protein